MPAITGWMISFAIAALMMPLQTDPARGADATGEHWWNEQHAISAPPTARPVGQPAAASLAPVLGTGADQMWTVATGAYTITRAQTLPVPARHPAGQHGPGWDVLTVADGPELSLDGRNQFPTGIEMQTWLRLPRTGGYARIYFARHLPPADPKEPAKPRAEKFLGVTLIVNTAAGNVSCGVSDTGGALFDIKALQPKSNWPGVEKSSAFNYTPRAYVHFLPGWPEEIRTRIEADMGGMPAAEDRWYNLRVELNKGSLRVWLDDHIVAHNDDATLVTEGAMKIALSAGGEMTGFTVRPLVTTPGFEPIRLGGYANGKALAAAEGADHASLPPAESPVTIDGIPFVFAGSHYGCDHLDISRSLLREANEEGYLATNPYRYSGSTMRDPARIQVRVPNAQFESLYVIAAADDLPDHVPVLTAAFFRPGGGFAESFTAPIPLATAQSSPADAKRLPIRLANGKSANLWLVKIPLNGGRLSSFSDMDIVEIEFAKNMALFRSYPDPISYGWHPAGLPSSVHVFAATLAESQIGFTWEPDAFGHVWQGPAQPAYTAMVTNRTGAAQTGKLTVSIRSYDGTDESRRELPVTLAAPIANRAPVPVPLRVALTAKLFGYYDITATLEIAGRSWTEKRSFARLAPDTRTPTYTGKGGLFGYWSYQGGHHTPNAWQIQRLMTMAGGRMHIADASLEAAPPDVQAYLKKHPARAAAGAWEVSPQAWMAQEPLDATKVAEYQKTILAAYHKQRDPMPAEQRPDHVFFFPEPHISARMTAGNIPDYWGEKPYEYTDEEKHNLRMFFNCAKIAAEAIRREFPDLKILIPWGDPGFVWPILRAGFPKELIDGSGLDIPLFERIPERQLHDQSIHRLLFVKHEFEKYGKPHPELYYCEGIFVPTEPGSVSYREQMDIYHRWALISMAHGIHRFYSGWFAFDCCNYYGAEHYGGCGIQRRIPYCDPKPAYAAYATMTDHLNEAEFDGWLPTGSLSTFALRFKHEKRGSIYAIWTLTGKRNAALTLDKDAVVHVTDSMNNTRDVKSKDKKITVSTDPSVIYIGFATPASQVVSIALEEPDHCDSKPAPNALAVADLGDGSWHFTSEKDTIVEKNHWGMMHYAGKFSAATVDDASHGKVLATTLEKQETVHELMPWYNVLRPAKPIVLKGAPSKFGLWVKGASDWGRVIYILRDAHGERWTSVGTKDQYNCDDPHSWSQFDFDGWRYLTFELPGHEGWDNFRKAGTTWWRADGEEGPGANVVDLPLALEAIVIEQRTHILYVNGVQPVASNAVQFGKLFAEYDTPGDATDEAVRISKLRMPMPKEIPALPNPIAQFEREGEAAPVSLTKLEAPTHYYDGTRMHVFFEPNANAKAHYLWVSAHADGQGAVNLTPAGVKPGALVYGLRPGIPLYYWIVWADAKGKMSKPSPVHREVTVDNFKEK